MKTQILQRPVFSDEQRRATIRCPQCGRTKVTDVTKYQEAPIPPKVKCACGHRFRIPIASALASRYRCPQCDGKGYRIMTQGKKVSVSADGYHYHTSQSKAPCTVCGGLGVRYPPARVRGTSVFHAALAYFVARVLRCIDWLAERVGADGSPLRTWLEMDIGTLGKRKVSTGSGYAHT